MSLRALTFCEFFRNFTLNSRNRYLSDCFFPHTYIYIILYYTTQYIQCIIPLLNIRKTFLLKKDVRCNILISLIKQTLNNIIINELRGGVYKHTQCNLTSLQSRISWSYILVYLLCEYFPKQKYITYT